MSVLPTECESQKPEDMFDSSREGGQKQGVAHYGIGADSSARVPSSYHCKGKHVRAWLVPKDLLLRLWRLIGGPHESVSEDISYTMGEKT